MLRYGLWGVSLFGFFSKTLKLCLVPFYSSWCIRNLSASLECLDKVFSFEFSELRFFIKHTLGFFYMMKTWTEVLLLVSKILDGHI